MPCFKFILDIFDSSWTPQTALEGKIAGLFTTRYVRADTQETALDKALQSARLELQPQGLTYLDQYNVDHIEQIAFWIYLKNKPGKGYTSYTAI